MALDFAVRAVRRRWPLAVFVPDGASDFVPRYEHLEFRDRSEIVAYRDRAACEQWRQIGYDPSLKGTMLYLMSDPTELTLVVEDDPSEEISSLVSSILDGLAKTLHATNRTSTTLP